MEEEKELRKLNGGRGDMDGGNRTKYMAMKVEWEKEKAHRERKKRKRREKIRKEEKERRHEERQEAAGGGRSNKAINRDLGIVPALPASSSSCLGLTRLSTRGGRAI